MKNKKHYHVKFSQKLLNRHNELKIRIQAIGMVFKDSVAETIEEMTKATGLFEFKNEKDVFDIELTTYIHYINDVISSVNIYVPNSDLGKLLEALKKDAVKHITGFPHDPHLDAPTTHSIEKARSILFPNGEADTKVLSKQMHKDVLHRVAKYLETVPKQHGGTL